MYSYQYLGVNISYTGNLKQASIDLSGKVTKALFGLNARIKEYSTLNVGTLQKLFDTLIQPILTYANEIWISDFKLDLLSDKYLFELVHLKSCKFSLGVHNKTSNLAVKCKLSRFPISPSVLKLCMAFITDLTSFHLTDCYIRYLKQIKSSSVKEVNHGSHASMKRRKYWVYRT